MPFNDKPFLFGCCTSNREHVRIEIEADNLSLRPKILSAAPRDDTYPTSHVQDTLAGVQVRGLNYI
jgi:hypothetical protein